MFLIKFTLLVLASVDKSCLNQLFIWWSPNSDFGFHHFFYIYVLRCYCKGKLFLLPHLSFYLLVSKWVYRFLFYLIDYILSYHYLFWCSACPRSGKWTLLHTGSCVLLTRPCPLSAFSYFLSWEPVPDSLWTFSASAVESASSPRSSRSFYWRMVFIKQIWVPGNSYKVGVCFLPPHFPPNHLPIHPP